MSDLHMVVILYAKQGREGQLRADLTALVTTAQNEEGNSRYELLEDGVIRAASYLSNIDLT
ncbi:putative quinol monooxygenase [Paraburkholderia sediminicola]|uniref:putative quinol monooxygenase n=1 Tax=Paraburkholderia sediminicola TaxID=458836 RepID=UPI0038BAC7B3